MQVLLEKIEPKLVFGELAERFEDRRHFRLIWRLGDGPWGSKERGRVVLNEIDDFALKLRGFRRISLLNERKNDFGLDHCRTNDENEGFEPVQREHFD